MPHRLLMASVRLARGLAIYFFYGRHLRLLTRYADMPGQMSTAKGGVEVPEVRDDILLGRASHGVASLALTD